MTSIRSSAPPSSLLPCPVCARKIASFAAGGTHRGRRREEGGELAGHLVGTGGITEAGLVERLVAVLAAAWHTRARRSGCRGSGGSQWSSTRRTAPPMRRLLLGVQSDSHYDVKSSKTIPVKDFALSMSTGQS